MIFSMIYPNLEIMIAIFISNPPLIKYDHLTISDNVERNLFTT